MKSVPEIVAIGEVGQGTVERFLASADTAFDPPEDGTGRHERAAVEEIECLSSRDFCALIPRVDRNPEALTAFECRRVAFTAFPLFNQRGNARRPWHRDQGQRAGHGGGRAGHVDDERTQARSPTPEASRAASGRGSDNSEGKWSDIRQRHPIPSSWHLTDVRLDICFHQRLSRTPARRSRRIPDAGD